MRRLILLFPLLFVACSEKPVEQELSDPGATVMPRGANGIVLASETGTETEPADPLPAPDLRVRLPDEYIASQAVTVNLDLDETEEQIVVFKRRDDIEDLIRILVVTYDPVRNSWIRSWEGATQATSVRSFTVYADDLVGDHVQEIVCFGINNAGEQTLDLFRRTRDALGLGVVFRPILSIAADVNITIQQVERSEAYETLETTAITSYPVIAERLDPESGDLLDTVATTYLWDFNRNLYVSALVEHISGTEIQDTRLRDLFSGTEVQFEEFLSGPWYESSAGDETRIVFFGTRDRTVVFHRGHLQQSFVWESTTKTVYGRGARLSLANEGLRMVLKLASVSVEDLNTVVVTVQGSEALSGTYSRLTGTLQSALLREQPVATISEINPVGLYRSDSGLEVVFSSPEFTWREHGESRSGGFAIFDIGEHTVLTLMFIDENRLPVSTIDYGVTFTEVTEEDRLVRAITLVEGEVGLAGFQSDGETQLVLEQIEVTETEPEVRPEGDDTQ
jgi:hypothetical protein